MNKKLAAILISSLITANIAFADYSFVDPADFTGDAFFVPPAVREQQEKNNELRRENAELRAMVRALLNAHTVEVEIERGRAKFYDAAQMDRRGY